ncbi:hypothetical protein F4814DRAFT_364121 [Daldinia grandis]|nr:hypothetical protein F4814DRAFT_364121 [Daldinia grandis]
MGVKGTKFPYNGRKLPFNHREESSLFTWPRRQRQGRTKRDRIYRYRFNPASNRTTVGVEFEFLLAVKPEGIKAPDPHPEERRWQARRLGKYTTDDPEFTITVRNEIIDKLRGKGVLAVKSAGDYILAAGFLSTKDFGWTSSKEQDVAGNALGLLPWEGSYAWDYFKTNALNIDLGSEAMMEQFADFHKANSLELHCTSDSDLDTIIERQLQIIYRGFGRKRRVQFQKTRDRFKILAKDRTRKALEEYELRVTGEVDPNSIDLPGAAPLYRAWTCTLDFSIKPDPASESFYERCIHLYQVPKDTSRIPASFISQDEDGNDTFIKNPIELYTWYQGELRTSILDYNHSDTLPAIQRACATLRESFCIHKPTSAIQTALHIHFGQEEGWSLLHLKKFSTLWLIVEEDLEKLHRRDRSNGSNGYCLSNRRHSPISYSLRHELDDNLSDIEQKNPRVYRENMNEMRNHVPFRPTSTDSYNLDEHIRNVIYEIWKYPNITELSRGMAGENNTYAKLRIAGNQASTITAWQKGTIEIRLMQGTLDAGHIAHWMKICERLIIWSRDSTAQEFYDGLLRTLGDLTPLGDIIGIPEETKLWFQDQQGDSGYFEYPDQDRVNWGEPFMVPGHGATHGPEPGT